MRPRPPEFLRVIAVGAPVFANPGWPHVNGLLTGAVLAPARRPVTTGLTLLGLGAEPPVPPSHRVRNRAVWSPLTARRLRRRR
jgi:hypothetical protein